MLSSPMNWSAAALAWTSTPSAHFWCAGAAHQKPVRPDARTQASLLHCRSHARINSMVRHVRLDALSMSEHA